MFAEHTRLSEEHLTDDTLLILASRHCSEKIKRSASAHLLKCETCRIRLKDTQRVRSAWAQIARQGLLAEERGAAKVRTSRRTTFPWKPVFAILGCCVVGCALLINSLVVPAASASSILTSAVQKEQLAGSLKAFRFEAAGMTCARGANTTEIAITNLAIPCANGVQLIRRAAWSTREPLSARAFASWRNSLPKKKDTVSRHTDTLNVRTVSPSGVLREASLTMRSDDYRPVSLNLVFDNREEITFTEDAPQPIIAATSPDSKFAVSVASEGANAMSADPLDGPEVDAWSLLEQLHADTGWEASVVRQPTGLEVKARVSSSAREQQFREAFQQNSAVKLDIQESEQANDQASFLAQRQLTGDSPALAHDWLEQQFPDVEERSKFVNGVLDRSKQILGRAFFLEQLRRSRDRMAPSDAKLRLSEEITHQKILLHLEREGLASAIEPMAGSPEHHEKGSLAYSEAEQLDVALGALLATSIKDKADYDAELKIVRDLL